MNFVRIIGAALLAFPLAATVRAADDATQVGPWHVQPQEVASVGPPRRGDSDKLGGRPYCGMVREASDGTVQILLSPAKIIEFFVTSASYKLSEGQSYPVSITVGPRKLVAAGDDVFVVNDKGLWVTAFEMDPLFAELHNVNELVVEGAGATLTFSMDQGAEALVALKKCVNDHYGWWD